MVRILNIESVVIKGVVPAIHYHGNEGLSGASGRRNVSEKTTKNKQTIIFVFKFSAIVVKLLL